MRWRKRCPCRAFAASARRVRGAGPCALMLVAAGGWHSGGARSVRQLLATDCRLRARRLRSSSASPRSKRRRRPVPRNRPGRPRGGHARRSRPALARARALRRSPAVERPARRRGRTREARREGFRGDVDVTTFPGASAHRQCDRGLFARARRYAGESPRPDRQPRVRRHAPRATRVAGVRHLVAESRSRKRRRDRRAGHDGSADDTACLSRDFGRLTAADWNRAGNANNRVELRARPAP